MTIKLGVVMDPIASIQIKKDSTFAMLLAAQQRGWQLHYMEQTDLTIKEGIAKGKLRGLKVYDDANHWFDLASSSSDCALHELDIILMRKDPPVDMQYIYTTQILELAERAGTLIVNKPQSLRDVNEKLFISWFPQCCVPTLVSSNLEQLRQFLQEQHDIICKPLAGMGGMSIFRLKENDPNVTVIFETMTQLGTQPIMLQRYIPEIAQGDKRILLIDGKPFPHALARIAAPGEIRANLAAGGHGIGVDLKDRDYWLCEQVAPTLQAKGLLFVGLDVIGDYITEINVTSPTCIRELDKIYKVNIAAQLLDCIEKKLIK